MNSSSISFDLILQILSRLPAKSAARFRCVSKEWASNLGSPYFTELFLTMSSAKPRLLFAIEEEEDGVWSFFSLPQLQNPYEKSSAEFHVKFSPGDLRIHPAKDPKYFQCAYASGLVYFNGCHFDDIPLVYNPNTGRYAILPYLHRYRKSYRFFRFEPIDKQYKVLFMAYPSSDDHHKIFTLGKDMGWRTIKCSVQHDIKSEGVSINGVLYYLGEAWYHLTSDYVIVCFDVRSETFTFIDVERFCRLINFNGKLAVIFWEDDVEIDWDHIDWNNFVRNKNLEHGVEGDVNIYSEDDVEDDIDTVIELHVWVQEDVEKQVWSKYAYTWNDDKFFRRRHVSVAGVTACGEIVFVKGDYTSEQPFYVFYFNLEMNTLRRVEIQGFGETYKKRRSVWTFVNHVEDLNVQDLKLLKLAVLSILGNPFTELFLTMSSSKPHLLFAMEEDGVWSFFSLPQLQNPYEKSSLATTEFSCKVIARRSADPSC